MPSKTDAVSITIRGQTDLAEAMHQLALVKPSPEKPYTFTLVEGEESRSLKQNRLSFLWYRIRGATTGHGDKHERCLCKLMYGCPVLLATDDDGVILDPEFTEFYFRVIDPLAYEHKLDAMEYVPVTSLMKVRQFAEYLDTIDKHSAAEGIVLPKPEDLYWEALMMEAER